MYALKKMDHLGSLLNDLRLWLVIGEVVSNKLNLMPVSTQCGCRQAEVTTLYYRLLSWGSLKGSSNKTGSQCLKISENHTISVHRLA